METQGYSYVVEHSKWRVNLFHIIRFFALPFLLFLVCVPTERTYPGILARISLMEKTTGARSDDAVGDSKVRESKEVDDVKEDSKSTRSETEETIESRYTSIQRISSTGREGETINFDSVPISL